VWAREKQHFAHNTFYYYMYLWKVVGGQYQLNRLFLDDQVEISLQFC